MSLTSKKSPKGCHQNSANVWLNTDSSRHLRVEFWRLPFSTPFSLINTRELEFFGEYICFTQNITAYGIKTEMVVPESQAIYTELEINLYVLKIT